MHMCIDCMRINTETLLHHNQTCFCKFISPCKNNVCLNNEKYIKFVRSRQPGIISVMFRSLLWFYKNECKAQPRSQGFIISAPVALPLRESNKSRDHKTLGTRLSRPNLYTHSFLYTQEVTSFADKAEILLW